MNKDDKLKEFLKEHDSVDYSAPVNEFENIHNKATSKSWLFYTVPAMAAAALVVAVNLSQVESPKEPAGDESLEDFIEYSMTDSMSDFGEEYSDLYED